MKFGFGRSIEDGLRGGQPEPRPEFLEQMVARVEKAQALKRPFWRPATQGALVLSVCLAAVMAALGGTGVVNNPLHQGRPFAASEVSYTHGIDISVQGGTNIGGTIYTKVAAPYFFGNCNATPTDLPSQVVFGGAGSTLAPVTCTASFDYQSGTLGGLVNGQTYTVTATQTPNSPSTASVTFKVDTAAPTGTISYTNGYQNTTSVSVAFSATDTGGSGVNTAGGQLQRASAPILANGNCGTFTAFANIGPAGVSSPYTDSTVVNGNCYQYQYVVSDNIGNPATITSASIVKVDTTAPTPLTITATPTTGNAVTISGTAGIAAGDSTTVTVVVCKVNSFPCSAGNTEFTSSTVVVNQSTGAYSVTTGNIGNKNTHYAQVTQTDAAGNTSSATSGQFTT